MIMWGEVDIRAEVQYQLLFWKLPLPGDDPSRLKVLEASKQLVLGAYHLYAMSFLGNFNLYTISLNPRSSNGNVLKYHLFSLLNVLMFSTNVVDTHYYLDSTSGKTFCPWCWECCQQTAFSCLPSRNCLGCRNPQYPGHAPSSNDCSMWV